MKLFFNLSPNRQNYFEHILEAFDSQHSTTKIQGLCKTRWVERHTCFETFYDLYMFICSCFEAIVDPNVYSDMNIDTNWEWDSETRTKVQGLLHSMKDPKILVTFIVTKNVLEIIKPIACCQVAEKR